LGIGLVLAAVLGYSGRAGAEEHSARVIAEGLFEEGKRLLDAGKVAEACARLAESQRLDAADGTLLLLGVCREREGKTASAWTDLKKALASARRAGRRDRIAIAERALEDLRLRLSYLILIVDAAESGELPTIALDGVPVAEGGWHTNLLVDPGEHVITVSASNEAPRTIRVRLAEAETRSIRVSIAALRAVSERGVERSAPRSPAPPVRTKSPAPGAGSAVRAERAEGPRRPLAFGLAGASLVGVGLGAYFGIRALAKAADEPEACRVSDAACRERARTLGEQKTDAANLATVSFGLAVVGASAAVILFLTEPAPAADGGRLRVGGVLASDFVGMEFSTAY
jgi:hypothetical protein